jgi:hypothetical protein
MKSVFFEEFQDGEECFCLHEGFSPGKGYSAFFSEVFFLFDSELEDVVGGHYFCGFIDGDGIGVLAIFAAEDTAL